MSRVTSVRVFGAAASMLLVTTSGPTAEPWRRARIGVLPDFAFAVVEIAPDGRRLRHLPHHDETGAVDLAHLRAALARLPQVRGLDPANAASARRHLEEHRRELSLGTR